VSASASAGSFAAIAARTVSWRHAVLGADEDLGVSVGLADELLGPLGGEHDERRTAGAVRTGELRGADDRHLVRLAARQHGAGVARGQTGLVRRTLVEDDFTGGLRWPPLVQLERVELLVAHPVGADGWRTVAADRLAGLVEELREAGHPRGCGRDPVRLADNIEQCGVELGPVAAELRFDAAHHAVRVAVDVREKLVEGLADGVGEDEGAAHEGDAEEDGEAGGEESELAGEEGLDRCPEHAAQTSRVLMRSRTRSAVGAVISSTALPSARNTTRSA
jgi:hypothetical protein